MIGICAHCNKIIDKPPYAREWVGPYPDKTGRYWHVECAAKES